MNQLPDKYKHIYPYNIDKLMNKFKKKYMSSFLRFIKCDKSIDDCLRLLFTCLKNYNFRPSTTMKRDCPEIKIRHLEFKNITFSLDIILRKISEENLNSILFSTFLASRNSDIFLVKKDLLTERVKYSNVEGSSFADDNFVGSSFADDNFVGSSFAVDNFVGSNEVVNGRSLSYRFILDIYNIPFESQNYIKQKYPERYNNFFKYNLNESELKSYLNFKKRYIIINMFLMLSAGGHANIIIYDTINKVLEIFEPNENIYFDHEKNNKYLSNFFKPYIGEYTLKIIKPSCDTRWQELEALMKDDYKKDFGGYCLWWTYLFSELRLLNPDLTGDEIHDKFKDCIGIFRLRKYIRAYVTDMLLFQREFLVFCKLLGLEKISEITMEISNKYLEWKYNIKCNK